MRVLKEFLCQAIRCLALAAGFSTSTAQSEAAPPTGDWIYRLGAKALFGVHLEPGHNDLDHIHGYLLFPAKFYMNPGPFFSGIRNGERRELVTAIAWKNGLLRLREVNLSAKPEYLDTFTLREVDTRHMDVTLFPNMPPITMERTTEAPELAKDWDPEHTYSPDDFVPDNASMAAIAAADQDDRKAGHIDWSKVAKADEVRRTLTGQLLHNGKLRSGGDFENAALVFQHGSSPEDYLLAHVLATVAISKGQRSALWLSAATLDRYLESERQPQIFGTQFSTPPDRPTSQEPYDRMLISDSLRRSMAVPIQAEQEKQRMGYDAERGVVGQRKSSTQGRVVDRRDVRKLIP